MKRPLIPLAGNIELLRINSKSSISYIRAMYMDIQCLYAIILYCYKYTEKHQLKITYFRHVQKYVTVLNTVIKQP